MPDSDTDTQTANTKLTEMIAEAHQRDLANSANAAYDWDEWDAGAIARYLLHQGNPVMPAWTEGAQYNPGVEGTPRYYEGGHWDIEDDELHSVAMLASKDGADEAKYKLTQVIAGLIYQLDRESLTNLALSQSLCPIHFWDYAGCFDDDLAECSQIRFIHPNHDT